MDTLAADGLAKLKTGFVLGGGAGGVEGEILARENWDIGARRPGGGDCYFIHKQFFE